MPHPTFALLDEGATTVLECQTCHAIETFDTEVLQEIIEITKEYELTILRQIEEVDYEIKLLNSHWKFEEAEMMSLETHKCR